MSTTGTRVRPTTAELFSTAHGNVFYTPSRTLERLSPPNDISPTFPLPRIRPRSRRPQSVYVTSCSSDTGTSTESHRREGRRNKERKQTKERDLRRYRSRRRSFAFDYSPPRIHLLGTLLAKLGSLPSATRQLAAFSPTASRRNSAASTVSCPDRRRSASSTDSEDPEAMRVPTMVDTMRPPAPGSHHRNSLMSMRSAKNVSASVAEIQKPIASGSGVQCSITLAEPNVFLAGFDHGGQNRPDGPNATSLLRGKLQLSVTKNVKIKSIALKLLGKARTEWPEGIPPLKVEQFEEETLRTQSLVFFHAMHEGIWETEYGNQCIYQLKGSPQHGGNLLGSLSPGSSNTALQLSAKDRNSNLSSKELKRLSLQSVNSRSFGKADSPAASPVQAKGYKVFYPGTYQYTFELPIDHHQLETIKLQYGSVKWALEAIVERAGTFKPNLHGVKEVSIVRVPDQLSLEMTEPISIARRWEDQMHYDIVISGKSFPIGSKIPIAFKLTPLAKVQLHKIKVLVTETVEYRTNDGRVTRRDSGRKILLLEKAAGKPLEKQYEQSEFRILSGGELSPDERQGARRAASRRRAADAAKAHMMPEPLPEPSDNILGDLDLGLESYWTSTEMEMNVQLPTCEMMAKDKALRLNPDCSWKNAQVYHWIKVVLRVSRQDADDPTGKRRRHFEISIDSPFSILNCRATQANTALPQYPGQDRVDAPSSRHATTCGCPDAHLLTPSPSSSTLSLSNTSPPTNERAQGNSTAYSTLPAPPRAAHLQSLPSQRVSSPLAGTSTWPQQADSRPSWPPGNVAQQPRPIELLRCPSYNPPAFDADDPPPPMATPPPNYDVIVGTPSVDGLADYFTRLADYDHDHAPGESGADYLAAGGTVEDTDSDSGDDDQRPVRIHSGGRVNVANPRTPGARLIPSRSLDLDRPAVLLSMAGVVRRGE